MTRYIVSKIKQNVNSLTTKHAYSELNVKNKYLRGNNNCAFFSYVYCCGKSGLGNGSVSTGDGALFRGKGFIHLTGRHNYTELFYNPLIADNPDEQRTIEVLTGLLETDIDLAIKVAMVYWKSRGINQVIFGNSFDSNNDEIRKVSIGVNGGDIDKSVDKIKGYSDRLNKTINAYNKLKNR